MATIFFSMAGEGRGHATRARALVEKLRGEHRCVLFSPGHAHELLQPAYEGTDVEVRQLPGLFLKYDRYQRVDQFRTALAGARFALRLERNVRAAREAIEKEGADLVVTDFEAIFARAARRAKVPLVAVDHQSFLCESDFSGLPTRLQWWAYYMGLTVRMVYGGRLDALVVSSFCKPPLRRPRPNLHQVGVLLRPELETCTPTIGDHLLVYLRRKAPDSLLDAIADAGVPAKVYGLGERPSHRGVSFHKVHEQRFLDDLTSCRALVCTAGNQGVGEALWLRKPVLGFPEPNNHEQFINAHFIESTGVGRRCAMETLDGSEVRRFLDDLDAMRARIDPRAHVGTEDAVAVLRRHLRDPANQRAGKTTKRDEGGGRLSAAPTAAP
jgi:uncharacterized protein (TIGR00661 family)